MTPMLTSLVSALAAAQPINASTWVTSDDYPRSEIRARHGGNAGFRLVVSPKGKPTRCDITASTGHEELDRLTCVLVLQRADFTPARDTMGNAAFSVFKSSVDWWFAGLGTPKPKPIRYDLEVGLNRLPNEVGNPTIVTLSISVNPTGQILDCSPMLSKPSFSPKPDKGAADRRVLQMLGPIACKEVEKNLKVEPAVDEKGNAVPSIQTANVQFKVETING